jgi:hypothetical protein
MALMNGARVGIAAQSLGVGEAAYRLARTYANSRKQFGGPIERLPAVAEMITDMKIHLEAARALTYETSRICDLETNNTWVLETQGGTGVPPVTADELKERKQLSKTFKRLNGMLTPMAKYYASEMCVKLADTCIQVLGGSGYMQDYPAERYLRDARITTIYEGTSQLQIVAAVRGVCSAAFEKRVLELEEVQYADPLLADLKEKLREGRSHVLNAITFVKGQGTDYLDLAGRKLVDAAISVLVGHLFLQQAAGVTLSGPNIGMSGSVGVSPALTVGISRAGCRTGFQPVMDAAQFTALRDRKKRVAKRFVEMERPRIRVNCEMIQSGDKTPLEEYALLAGPVPPKD